ncbi:Metallo-dependent phosphatase-like protein [Glomus cerebriforme]|uniref:Metallo-dependent phosphatase-like protein n=1 Tax=Glomus cerebriforme TaxID=658196 RepID=A0A397TA31_9GLOM|nr:Metallo-dependent phosphatase-like protein [Glomus cerebriforme]
MSQIRSMSQEIFVHLAPKIPKKLSPEWTRFVCMSDTHNSIDPNKYQVPDGDIFIHAGDMTRVGMIEEVRETVNWIKSLPHEHKVVIAGNHDLTLDETFYEKNWNRFHYNKEDSNEAINIIKNAGHGIVYLYENSFTIPHKGIQIWGSPWTPEFYEWAFNGQRGQFLKEKWGQIPQTTHILMTHGPPNNILDKTYKGDNVGCKDLLERIEEIKPYVHVFGHIHEGYGILEKTWESTENQDQDRKKTIFINASTNTLNYSPENTAVIFDFPPLNSL